MFEMIVFTEAMITLTLSSRRSSRSREGGARWGVAVTASQQSDRGRWV